MDYAYLIAMMRGCVNLLESNQSQEEKMQEVVSMMGALTAQMLLHLVQSDQSLEMDELLVITAEVFEIHEALQKTEG